jgi:hypothetical protein
MSMKEMQKVEGRMQNAESGDCPALAGCFFFILPSTFSISPDKTLNAAKR